MQAKWVPNGEGKEVGPRISIQSFKFYYIWFSFSSDMATKEYGIHCIICYIFYMFGKNLKLKEATRINFLEKARIALSIPGLGWR